MKVAPINFTDGEEKPNQFQGIETTEAFLSRFKPPAYLVDGVMQSNRLYSLSGFTGHGKTSIAMLLSSVICTGDTFAGRDTEKGSVLFLAGENPDNVMTQFLALAKSRGLDPEALPMFWHYGQFGIEATLDRIMEESEMIPDLRLIVADTLQAFFPGDNDNDNMQMLKAARQFRPLLNLSGNPTVLVPCHPSGKRPDKDNLVPRGGGAFLNEMDGNFTVWKDADGTVTFHTQGKHRGAHFDPLIFKIEEKTFPDICDARGRPMPQAVPRIMVEAEQVSAETERHETEVRAPAAIEANPLITVRGLADAIRLGKSRAQEVRQRLIDQRLVKIRAKKLVLTAEGEEVLADERGPK